MPSNRTDPPSPTFSGARVSPSHVTVIGKIASSPPVNPPSGSTTVFSTTTDAVRGLIAFVADTFTTTASSVVTNVIVEPLVEDDSAPVCVNVTESHRYGSIGSG